MRILLDHCVPARLRRSFPDHLVRTAREMGWEEMRNGELLAVAAADFDVILTVDQNIKHEQNLVKLPLSVVVLIARSNKVADLVPLAPEVERVLSNIRPGVCIEIEAPFT